MGVRISPSRPEFIARWTGVVPARSHKPYDAGANPAFATIASLAQLVEQHSCKVKVVGSKPTTSTKLMMR